MSHDGGVDDVRYRHDRGTLGAWGDSAAAGRRTSSTVETIEIVKMREAKHDDQTRLFLITDQAIVVYLE